MECQSVDEVIQKALELVRGKLNSQVASIFLFTKNRVIKRKGINGIDKEGNSIDNSWFPDEEYAPGASFSGKAIPTFDAESGFGEPQWSNDVQSDFILDEKTQKPYVEKLGNLKSAISVPLNGRYITFGTIEVINKLDDSKFAYNDVYWLILVANNVANFISDFIRKRDDEVRDQILSAVRSARGDYFLQGVLHQYKNELLEFHQSFKTILDSNSKSKIEQIINNKISFIEERVKTIQADSQPETITAININDVTKQVLQSFSELIGIEFTSSFNSQIPIIEINKAKIKYIVYNLVSNAIKAIQKTNNKTGKIFVSTEIITVKRIQYIQIMVEDNGIGIPNELREEIFNKGFTTSTREGVTDMGLFFVRESIVNYGGKIYFESTVGKGTKFYIKIPLRRYLVS